MDERESLIIYPMTLDEYKAEVKKESKRVKTIASEDLKKLTAYDQVGEPIKIAVPIERALRDLANWESDELILIEEMKEFGYLYEHPRFIDDLS